VVNEVRAALLDEFFERRGTEKASGTPLARNFPAVFNYKAQGWRLEGVLKGQCKSVVDGSRLDQYQFGMLRDEWRARKGAAA
jgi:ribosomal-protein-alanine N-acetyltransferase